MKYFAERKFNVVDMIGVALAAGAPSFIIACVIIVTSLLLSFYLEIKYDIV